MLFYILIALEGVLVIITLCGRSPGPSRVGSDAVLNENLKTIESMKQKILNYHSRSLRQEFINNCGWLVGTWCKELCLTRLLTGKCTCTCMFTHVYYV